MLSTPLGSIIEPKEMTGKQVRQNSQDLWFAEQLAQPVITRAKEAKCIFVEVPVGSQSARAMASYGITVGVLGAVRALGIPLIEVTATENKRVFTGKETATKDQMIKAALAYYPDLELPVHRGVVQAKAEHIADAIASIHAGVRTPLFQNLMRLFETV